MRTWKVVAVLAALSMSGCSFYMATNPEGWKPSQEPTCSDASAAPGVDSVMAVIGALIIAGGVQCYSDNPGQFVKICRVGTTIGVVTALLWGGGAVVGWRRTRVCRKAKRQHASWIEEERRRIGEETHSADCDSLLNQWRRAYGMARETACRQIQRECPGRYARLVAPCERRGAD